jgi:hypothetical protein
MLGGSVFFRHKNCEMSDFGLKVTCTKCFTEELEEALACVRTHLGVAFCCVTCGEY